LVKEIPDFIGLMPPNGATSVPAFCGRQIFRLEFWGDHVMRLTSFKSLAATAAAGALALGFTVLAPASAQASSATRSAISSPVTDHASPMEMQRRVYRGGGHRGGFRHGHRGGRGFGPGAAVGLGAAALIIGGAAAAAASQPGYYRECWVERRWVDTPWGPEPRRVRVCN
jgi:hypothetical protein